MSPNRVKVGGSVRNEEDRMSTSKLVMVPCPI